MTEKKGKDDFGMSGDEIFRALNVGLEVSPDNTPLHMNFAVIQMQFIHARALACHCECLGMNAENCIAACTNSAPPYTEQHYFQALQKWGLTDEKGNSII